MANSGGGMIIYCVATSDSDKTRPICIQPVHKQNIETFDRVLNSQIKPQIRGLRKKLIPEDTPQVMIVVHSARFASAIRDANFEVQERESALN
jgi:hypothetical protein